MYGGTSPKWGDPDIDPKNYRLSYGDPQKGIPLSRKAYLEGQGDLVSSLITHVSHIKTQSSPLLTYLLGPNDPPSKP